MITWILSKNIYLRIYLTLGTDVSVQTFDRQQRTPDSRKFIRAFNFQFSEFSKWYETWIDSRTSGLSQKKVGVLSVWKLKYKQQTTPMRVKDNTLIFYDLHRFERNEGSGISFPSYPFSSSFTWKRFNLFPQEAGASLRSSTLLVLLFLTHTHTYTYTKAHWSWRIFSSPTCSSAISVLSPLNYRLPSRLKSGPTSSQLEITLLLFLSRYYKLSLSFSAVLANERERED